MNSIRKKLNFKVFVITILTISLLFTSTVLAMSTLSIENNVFHTGIVDIEIGGVDNDDEYYFDDDNKLINNGEFNFEPGATIEKRFFIENRAGEDGCDVFYKMYFSNVKGKLADELTITLKDIDGNIYFDGKPCDFTEDNVSSYNKPLGTIENKHYFVITFYYPKECGNETEGEILEFDFCAKAVQTKNNSNRDFEYRG